jgi:hypothetical protein
MIKKTERKNRTNLNVEWPTTPFFTIEELWGTSTNANMKEITLRVKLAKQIEAGKVVEIGCKTGEQGRPKKVFSLTPVSQATLDLAKAQNIQPVDKIKVQNILSKTSVVTNIVSKQEPVTTPS